MSTGGDAKAVGTTHLIDGRVWVVTAVYPVTITTGSSITGENK